MNYIHLVLVCLMADRLIGLLAGRKIFHFQSALQIELLNYLTEVYSGNTAVFHNAVFRSMKNPEATVLILIFILKQLTSQKEHGWYMHNIHTYICGRKVPRVYQSHSELCSS